MKNGYANHISIFKHNNLNKVTITTSPITSLIHNVPFNHAKIPGKE